MTTTRAMTVIEAVAGYAAEKLIRTIVSEGKNDPRRVESITVSLKLRGADGQQARYTITQLLGATEKKLLEESAMEPPLAVILDEGV